MKKIIALFLMITYSSAVFSHSGGTDSYGCHTDSSTGSYHCHNDSSGSSDTAIASALAILLVTFLFRGGSQQMINETNEDKKQNKTTTPPITQQSVN